MRIQKETEFALNDEVYFIENGLVVKGTVVSIMIEISPSELNYKEESVFYRCKNENAIRTIKEQALCRYKGDVLDKVAENSGLKPIKR